MKVYHQSTFDRWPFDDNSIQAIITSPPYYSLRKYDIPDIIIGGKNGCEHEWGEVIKERVDETGFQRNRKGLNKAAELADGNVRTATTDIPIIKRESHFCIHCNAWRGQYGLEPTFQLFIEHTLLWCQEAKRVLREDGIFFLNLGDSYNTISGNAKQAKPDINSRTSMSIDGLQTKQQQSLPSKCLLDIPFRVSIKLVDELGFIKRNNIPWYSPNKMPESVTDRFSKKHEMIFMMVKNPKYYFDLDSIREIVESHSRTGIKKPYNSKFNNSDEAKGQRTLSEYRQLCRSQGLPEGHPNGKNPGDIFIFNTQPSPEKHYAMWPESLVERMIKCSTKPGDIVLDPFAGSGTTLRVADKLNREAYGIDLGYSEIQARRLSNIQKELL